MTDRWQQVEKLCLEALELEESQRAGFLKDACAGDEELRQEVESLLKFDDRRGDRFIEQPALELAAKMMAHEKPESLVGQQLGPTRSFLCSVLEVWASSIKRAILG
jgi:eukaryotic-like serine/threonine-protein kinase